MGENSLSSIGELVPIEILAGVQPDTDRRPFSTRHYTYTDKIRFKDGYPQKIGGWNSVTLDCQACSIQGVVRTVYTTLINGKYYGIIGSNEKLYSLIGTQLTNITPFAAATTPAANSLATLYGTLGSNPMAAINGSNTVTITDTNAGLLVAGDRVTISGATAFAGFSTGELNTQHIVRTVGVNQFTIYIPTAANATVSGGGASVVRASGLITLTKAMHGLSNGDRVKITGAANTGGILAADINAEFIIRGVTTNTFNIYTAGVSSSSVSGGGGASTVYQVEIPAGQADETAAFGYGAGLYGVGLYGNSKQSSLGRSYPRIWFCDTFGEDIIMTAGNQTGVYVWDGSGITAPILVPNAPTDVNYAFVSDNILVTFGAGAIENKIFASDQNDITIWTASAVNQVFEDNIEGAGRLVSHVSVENYNLIFSESRTYRFQYIGQPFVWSIELVDPQIGIISPRAAIAVNGVAYWMGQENFYQYRSGFVETCPSATQEECTALNYVFGNLNYAQKSKIFCWYNKEFNEVWWHYPSQNSNDPDRIIRYDIKDRSWSIDTMDRTAAEYPQVLQSYPLLAATDTLYRHEIGYNDDGDPMPFTIRTNRRFFSKDTGYITAIAPDNIVTSGTEYSVNIKTYAYPMSSSTIYDQTYTLTSTTDYVPVTARGRFWEYEITGEDLDQEFVMNTGFEEVQKGSRR